MRFFKLVKFAVCPSGSGSGNISFVAAGVPDISSGSLSRGYVINTWHANLYTYNKIIFDDVQSSTILTAIFDYTASEDIFFFNREKSVRPDNPFAGQEGKRPEQRTPDRRGRLD